MIFVRKRRITAFFEGSSVGRGGILGRAGLVEGGADQGLRARGRGGAKASLDKTVLKASGGGQRGGGPRPSIPWG